MSREFAPGPLSAKQADLLNELLRWRDAFDRMTVAAPLALTRSAGIPAISAGGIANAISIADPTAPAAAHSVPAFTDSGALAPTPLTVDATEPNFYQQYVVPNVGDDPLTSPVRQLTVDNTVPLAPVVTQSVYTNGTGGANGLTETLTPTQYTADYSLGGAIGGVRVYETAGALAYALTADTFDLTDVTVLDLTGVTVTGFSGAVAGAGTTNRVPKWTGGSALGDSSLADDGTTVTVRNGYLAVADPLTHTQAAVIGAAHMGAFGVWQLTTYASDGTTPNAVLQFFKDTVPILRLPSGGAFSVGTDNGASGTDALGNVFVGGMIKTVGAGAVGTVTSVNLTAPAAGATFSGGPVTGSGAITMALANDLLAVESLSSAGLAARTATDTWAVRTITGTADKIDVTNGSGASGNPTLTIASTYAGQTSIVTLGTVTTGTWDDGTW